MARNRIDLSERSESLIQRIKKAVHAANRREALLRGLTLAVQILEAVDNPDKRLLIEDKRTGKVREIVLV
jgi:ribosomal protein L7Ae-like RNA K-turn-binding protein